MENHDLLGGFGLTPNVGSNNNNISRPQVDSTAMEEEKTHDYHDLDWLVSEISKTGTASLRASALAYVFDFLKGDFQKSIDGMTPIRAAEVAYEVKTHGSSHWLELAAENLVKWGKNLGKVHKYKEDYNGAINKQAMSVVS